MNVHRVTKNPSSGFENILFPRDPIHHDAGQLAHFLTELEFDAIPKEAIHTAKRVVLDTIGCIIAGADTTLGRQLLSAYGTALTSPGCTVPGTALSLPPSLAAKLSSWLSDVLDYEDVASGHPSATVVPSALAMAEHLRASPRRFLTGIVAGYEAGLRVHDAVRASQEVYKRFAVYHAWHGLAGGAAAMKVTGGSEAQVRSALGHAAANTSLPIWYVQYGRPAHALKANYGQMTLGGVDAALCAAQDIIGPFTFLSDRERGFAKVIGSDNFYPEELSAGLGERWRTLELGIKMFPSCAFLHTTIDAARNIVANTELSADEIDAITIKVFSRITDWFVDPAPASEIDGQLSVEYVTAMALMGITPSRHWYDPQQMKRPEVSTLIGKMTVQLDPDADRAFWEAKKYPSTLIVKTSDGREINETVEWAPGHWRRPVSDTDLVGKFLENVYGTPLQGRGEEIVDSIMSIDSAQSMDTLLKLLRT